MLVPRGPLASGLRDCHGRVQFNGKSKISKAGVDAGGEALLGGDFFAECHEGGALVGTEGGAQVRLVLGGEVRDFFEGVSAGFGEDERIGAAIAGFAMTLHQFTRLKIIYEDDHAAGEDAKALGEFLLTAIRHGSDHAQEAGVGRREAERGDAPAETLSGVRAELGEQKSRATRLASGVRRTHKVNIAGRNKNSSLFK